jgi:phosphoserine phosphatase RsbU/P
LKSPPDFINDRAMARLVITQGAGTGGQVPISEQEIILGRDPGLALTLKGGTVSRQHARLTREGAGIWIEDLSSRNGTYVNERRISERTLLKPNDSIRIGSYFLRFEEEETVEQEMTIQRQTLALRSNPELFREHAGQKLQAILEIAHRLADSLDLETLLERLVDQLLGLFPQADRAIVVQFQSGEPVVRVMRERHIRQNPDPILSRTVLNRVYHKGIAVLAEDTQKLQTNQTLQALGIRSLISVPLRSQQGRVFGAVQLDRFRTGEPFTSDDLYLLTAVCLQVSVVLENANMHKELLAREQVQRELRMAREIQEGFLPRHWPSLPGGPVEFFAELHPAQEVSGDFYDYVVLDEKRLAFAVADVSGKGMPAALFMTRVWALWRHIALGCGAPAEILTQLNDAVAMDNPTCMFASFLLGIYDVETGHCLLARAGHPAPLLCKAGGDICEIEAPSGCLLGIDRPCPSLSDYSLCLQPGDTLLFYTDGVTEASSSKASSLFGVRRLTTLLSTLPKGEPLISWGERIRQQVNQFSGGRGPQDDLTLLFLRRPA